MSKAFDNILMPHTQWQNDNFYFQRFLIIEKNYFILLNAIL